MQRKTFDVSFSKGLNTKNSPKQLQDGECQIAQDCNFDQEGSVISRNWNFTHLEFDYPPKSIFPYSNLITQLNDGGLYDGETSIGTGYSTTPFESVEYNDVWYGVNGGNKLRYNGSDLYNIGNPAPMVDLILVANGGSLTGTYSYKYTYVDIYGNESLASTVKSIEADSENISITVTTSGSDKIKYIKIYRLGGTLTTWYFIAQLDDATATYVDSIPDGDLSASFNAENNNTPQDMYFLTEHYERLIGARTVTYPNSVWYSGEYQPEYWGNGTLNQQYLISNSKECTGILSWGRVLVFTKKHEIHVFEGTNPATWYKRRANSAVGHIAPYALGFWKTPILCSYDGLYSFNADLSDKFTSKIDPWFTGDNKDHLTEAVGCVYRNKFYFGVADETLVVDLLFKRFYTYSFGLTAIAYDQENGILYGGVGDNVVKMDQDTNESSESVNFQLKSKAYPLNNVEGKFGEIQKYFTTIDTQGEDVSFKIYIDGTLKQTKTLNTASLTRVDGSFGGYKGMYAEFEFVYSGTKRIQIDTPIVINPEDS